MKLSDRALSWAVVAAFFTVGGGALGFWWLQSAVIAPTCGPVAEAQLNQAAQELQRRILSLRVVGLAGDCDSGRQTGVVWEADDPNQVRTDAVSAGCRVDESDPEDLAGGDLSESLTCKTAGRDVVLVFDLGGTPVEGELFLS
jgi:hypothetical protein